MADGYLQDSRLLNNKSTSVGLRIRLSKVDYDHLEKLNESMDCNKPITIQKNYGDYKANDLAEFYITNTELINDLYDIGFPKGAKTGSEIIPYSIDTFDYKKSFILGFFDGDGSISITDKTKEFSIVSNKKILKEIENFIVSNLNIKFNKITLNGNGKNLYRLRTCNKKNISKLYNFLYKDEKIYLDRKKEIFKTINNYYN